MNFLRLAEVVISAFIESGFDSVDNLIVVPCSAKWRRQQMQSPSCGQEFGKLTIISVTHHLHTLEYCDMVVHLKSGGCIDRIECLGSASSVF